MEPVQPHEIPNNTRPLTNRLGDVSEVDWTSPNIARMYDYGLGGAVNFAVDRAAADEFLEILPHDRECCRSNRAFLWRVVRTLTTEYGIDQFLDLGSGVPTVGNVHEIAHQHNPATRVAYVDCESIAVQHARRLLGEHEHRVSVTQADIREPDTVLRAEGVAGLLDFTRPVAVFALGILDMLPEFDTVPLLARYRNVCVPGSALAVSHKAQLEMSDQQLDQARQALQGTANPYLWVRTHDEIAALLPGYELLEPGVVSAAEWRPDQPVSQEQSRQGNVLGAVGLLSPASSAASGNSAS